MRPTRYLVLASTAVVLAGSLFAKSKTNIVIEPGPAHIDPDEAALGPDPARGAEHAVILVHDVERDDAKGAGTETAVHVRAKILSNEGRGLGDVQIPVGDDGRLKRWWGKTLLPDGSVLDLPQGELKEQSVARGAGFDLKVLKEIADTLPPGSVTERLRAAYDWVGSNIRRTGFLTAEELEAAGRDRDETKYGVKGILERKEGTAFEVAALFAGLARRIGAEAYLVFAPDRTRQYWDPALKSLGSFDYLLVGVRPPGAGENNWTVLDPGSGLAYGEVEVAESVADGLDRLERGVGLQCRTERFGLGFDPRVGIAKIGFDGPWLTLTPDLGPAGDRQHPLILDYQWIGEEEILVKSPPGFTPGPEAVAPVRVDSPFGRYTLAIESVPDGFRIRRFLAFGAVYVAPEQMGTLRSFVDEVRRHDRTPLEFRRQVEP